MARKDKHVSETPATQWLRRQGVIESAEQIVDRARANGTPVWYLRADNEGHGFQRKENADYLFWATTLFLRETLLK